MIGLSINGEHEKGIRSARIAMNRHPFLLVGVLIAGAAYAAPVRSQVLADHLDLPAAIATALENNFAIRQARERIRQQEGIVTTFSAARLPTVEAAGSYQKSDVTTIVTGPGGTRLFLPAGQFWRISLVATQTLYAGGGVRASIHGADLSREAAILDLRAIVDQTLLEVRIRFFDVLLAREQVKVQDQNLELLQARLQDTTYRTEAGTLSEFERLRAEVAVANARPPLIRARNDFRLAFEELRRALGAPTKLTDASPDTPEIQGSLTYEPTTVDLRQAMDAMQTRPDLQRLSKLAAARAEDVGVARSGYYPQVSLSAGGELRKGPMDRFRDSVTGRRASAQSQLKVTGATRGLVTQARSRLEQAKLDESEAQLRAEVEVRTAVFAVEQAAELTAAMQQTAEQAAEAVRLATVRFENGAAVQLDVLRAQVELTTARSSQLRAFHGHNVAVAQLKKAMGISEVEYRAVEPGHPAVSPLLSPK